MPRRAILHTGAAPRRRRTLAHTLARTLAHTLARTLARLLAATSTAHAANRAGRAGHVSMRCSLTRRLCERRGHVSTRGGGHGIEELQCAVEPRY